MLLSILIPSLTSRSEQFLSLKEELFRQIIEANATEDVEVLDYIDSGEVSIGAKRNALKAIAKGEAGSYIDDDDSISSTYIKRGLEFAKSGKDCASLRGVITFDGDNPELFEHSIKYNEWRTNSTGPVKYERFPNHLNFISMDIIKQFDFPEINHGEDQDWSTQIHKSGMIKSEYYIDETLYHYQYVSNK